MRHFIFTTTGPCPLQHLRGQILETWDNSSGVIRLASGTLYPDPADFHILLTLHHRVTVCGKHSEGKRKEITKLKRSSLPSISYSSALPSRHGTGGCVMYRPTVWDNLKILGGQRPCLCPLCLSHCLPQCFELTCPVGPRSTVFISKVPNKDALNYMWLSFVSVKMEVRLPQPRVTWDSFSLLNLFISQGFQVPINSSAVDSHLQYNYFYTLVWFFFLMESALKVEAALYHFDFPVRKVLSNQSFLE